MAFKFVIDGRLYDTVYEDFTFLTERGSISENEYSDGLINTFEISDLNMYGDDYDVIYQKYLDNDACGILPVTIIEECCSNYKYEGAVNLADIKFEPTKCKAIVPITDNGYGAYLKQSKDIDINLGASTDKSGNSITPIDFTPLFLQHPLPDVNQKTLVKNVQSYKLSDAFRFVIEWLSEGNLTFESDLINPTTGSEYYLTTGHNVNGDSLVSPIVSLSCLLNTVKVLFNANWSIKDNVFRLEKADYFFDNSIFKSVDNAKGLVFGQCEEFIYSSVEIGDEDAMDTYGDGGTTISVTVGEDTTLSQTGYLSFPQTDLGGYIPTQLSGNISCSSGTNLDLKSSCIHWDSNTIEHLAFTNYSKEFYDNNKDRLNTNYIIEVDNGTINPATGNQDFYPFVTTSVGDETTRSCFNPSLTNENILSRWSRYIPSNLNTVTNCEDTSVRATSVNGFLIGTVPAGTPSTFAELNLIMEDVDKGFFDKTTGLFTAPKADFYVYNWNYHVNTSIAVPENVGIQTFTIISKDGVEQRISSGNVIIPSAETGDSNFKDLGAKVLKRIYVDGSYTVKQILSIQNAKLRDIVFSSIQSYLNIDSDCNNEFVSAEPQRKNCATWTTLESSCKFNEILSNTDKNISVNGLPFYIKRMTRDAKTGVSEWEGMY